MSKTITLRLSDDEYEKIALLAKTDNRPISNFIITTVLKEIENSFYVDAIEMTQIMSDKKLLKKIKKRHGETPSLVRI